MSNILFIICLAFGVIFYLFFIFRKLKEDYVPEKIFAFSFLSLIGAAIGIIVSVYVLAPILPRSIVFDPKGLWFWLGIIGGIPGVILGIYKYKMRAYELIEATVLGLLFLGVWAFLTNAIFISLFLGSLIIVYFIVDMKYKSFSWYRSGKIGLAGLSVLGLLFLGRSVVALINPGMISLLGKSDAIISAIVAFVVFLSIYNLSGDI